jgi:hypothetical protein
MADTVQLRVFLAGRVAVETDAAVLGEERFAGRQGPLFFAYLVAEQGRPVPRDELAEVLWGPVRADDDMIRGQKRGNPMPGGVRSRVPVQEHDRRALAAVADSETHVPHVDVLESESLEERHLPGVPYPARA